jgi:hypothetical protein
MGDYFIVRSILNLDRLSINSLTLQVTMVNELTKICPPIEIHEKTDEMKVDITYGTVCS